MPETIPGGQGRSDATTPASRQPRWIAPAALVIAVIAVAVAGWALATRGPSDAAAPIGESEVVAEDPGQDLVVDPAAARARVCEAVATVSRAVQMQTNSNLGPEPVAQTAIAGNARLALLGGGQYLAAQVGDATPPELADPVRRFAQTLQDIGINALTGVTNQDPVQQGRLAEGERLRQEVAGLCG